MRIRSESSDSGTIVEILSDTRGALCSESLNLSFRWTDQHHSHVRLLRPCLPDGTPITTAIEERNFHAAAKKRIESAELRLETEQDLRAEAEARAVEETKRRQALERELEQLRRQLENR